MYRLAISRAACRCAMQSARRSVPIARPALQNATVSKSRHQSLAPSMIQGIRCYSAAASLQKPEVEGRIIDILKNFDKIADPAKLTTTSHFSNDLGLDSLDTVEVVMAIEEEFSIEIPDKDADNILSVDKAVSYILGSPDAH